MQKQTFTRVKNETNTIKTKALSNEQEITITTTELTY